MSVNVKILYCEGNSQSPDLRVISQIVPRECRIIGIGGKTFNFALKVISDRITNPRLAGLADRDFHDINFIPDQTPLEWSEQGTFVGWVWERKEIENYLLDSVVVQKALGHKAPPIKEYEIALQKAAEILANYTAARATLSYFYLQNSWGEQISKTYRFPGLSSLGKDKCRENIKQIFDKKVGDRILDRDQILNKFDEFRKQLRPGGEKFQYYLTFFAGKDLLYLMKEPLEKFGFCSKDPRAEFIERVLKGLENSPENVWTWLPEWKELRKLIENTQFDHNGSISE
ncbi:hypothetical protein [Planktothrix mougeotii]|uniref:DUF4435 domain-containing protein n=1 Tax=Planktothrix mougeotii LEGE 06226 TaxID=1828728 RepID=A0ABR9U8E1_9CYAN|nr:hypothetical protein [Planktothrix mougeotii]MBE9142715.1 hypothetical protein [Planktothrix mougeotii LEGE 06226]